MDIFRVDYYPHRAHAKYMMLNGDEIAMLTQIINLIYMNNGPIANDGRYLSQSIYDFGTAKCNRLVKILLEKGHIFLTDDNKIGQVMALKQLKLTRDRAETRARSGSLGGKTKAENQQNQQDNSSTLFSTNTNTSNIPPIVPQGGQTQSIENGKEKQNGRSKRKSKKQRVDEAIYRGMLKSGYDPEAEEDRKHEDPANIDADLSEL